MKNKKSYKRGKHYSFSISADQLNQEELRTICLLDQGTNVEIARLDVSPEGILLKGHGDDIKLTVIGEIEANVLSIHNPSGSVTLDASIKAKNDLYVYAQSKKLVCKKSLRSEKNLKIDVSGEFIVEKPCELFGHSYLEIQAEAVFFKGKAVSQDKLKIKSQKTLQMFPRSQIYSKSFIAISVNSLKDIRGDITTDNDMVIDAKDSIYLRGSANLLAKSKLSITTNALMSAGKAILKSEGSARVEVKKILIVEKGSEWSSENLIITAETYKNYSRFVNAKNISIHVNGEFINHKHAKIKTSLLLKLTGNSVWNAGDLDYGKELQVSLNRVFVHGLSYSDDLWGLPKNKEELFCRPTVCGENATIVSGVFFNIAGLITSRNLSLSSIAEINIGINIQNNSRRSRLISLNLGLDIPNIGKILSNIKIVFEQIIKGDFSIITEDLFSRSNVLRVYSLTSWIVRKTIPALSVPLDITWCIVMLVLNMAALIQYCYVLYRRKEEIELRDIIPVMNLLKSNANQMVLGETQLESFVRNGLNSPHNTPQPIADIAKALAFDAISFFGGSTFNEALVGFDIGSVNINMSLQNRTGLSYRIANIQTAFHISDSFYLAYHGGYVWANQLAIQGYQLNNSSQIRVTYLFINIERLDFLETIDVHSKYGYLRIPNAKSLLESTGVAKNILFSEELCVITATPIILDKKIDRLCNIVLVAPTIKTVVDIYTEKSICLEATKGNLELQNKVISEKNISLISTAGNVVTQNTITAKQIVLIDAHEAYQNQQGHVSGRVVSIHVSEGDIVNDRGVIQAETYLQGVSDKGTIRNTCVESEIQGQYDKMKRYENSQIIGGSGLESSHQGVGLYLKAGEKIINSASVICSSGNNYIEGNHGIENEGRANTYIVYDHKSKKWYGKKSEEIIADVQIQPAVIRSTNGDNIVSSKNGEVYSCAAELVSNGQNHVYGKNGVKMKEIISKTRHYKYESYFWGLISKKREEIHQQAIPTVITDLKGTHIYSEGDVDLTGVFAISPESFEVKGRNVKISAPILGHWITEESRSFSIDSQLLSSKNFLLDSIPFNRDTASLLRSKSGAELAINSLNTVVNSTNTVNTLFSGIKNHRLEESLINGSNLTETSLTFTKTKKHSYYQTVSQNGIQVGSLKIEAEETITLENGVPIIVAGNFDIRAKHIIQSGATLQASESSQQESISLNASITGLSSIGIGFSESEVQVTIFSNQKMKVGGTLTIQADDWTLNNATISAEKISKDVANLSVVTEQNYYSHRGKSIGIDSNGNFSVNDYSNGKSSEIHSSLNNIKQAFRGLAWFEQKIQTITHKDNGVNEIKQQPVKQHNEPVFPRHVERSSDPLPDYLTERSRLIVNPLPSSKWQKFMEGVETINTVGDEISSDLLYAGREMIHQLGADIHEIMTPGQPIQWRTLGNLTLDAAFVYGMGGARIGSMCLKGFSTGLERFGLWGSNLDKIAIINPNDIRFSQQSISYLKVRRSGRYTFDEITESMRQNGWQGEPIDVVQMPDDQKLTTIDNSRVLAARKTDTYVHAIVRRYNERLPKDLEKRFEHPQVPGAYPKTWGEAIEHRLISQQKEFIDKHFPGGTYEEPRINQPKTFK